MGAKLVREQLVLRCLCDDATATKMLAAAKKAVFPAKEHVWRKADAKGRKAHLKQLYSDVKVVE